jgi:aconitate hydratase
MCCLRRMFVGVMQVGPFDKVSILGLTTFAPGKPLTFRGVRPDGTSYEFPVNHTFNENQITWFKAGSALNAMGQQLHH